MAAIAALSVVLRFFFRIPLSLRRLRLELKTYTRSVTLIGADRVTERIFLRVIVGVRFALLLRHFHRRSDLYERTLADPRTILGRAIPRRSLFY